MKRSVKLIATATALASLSACGSGQFAGLNFIAGSQTDEGQFGNPTMNNHLIMTGQQTAMVNLSRRFANDVPTTINFAFNRANLDESAMATLRQQAEWIRQYPAVRFRVYGHTDLVGSDSYNKSLGLRRANAAVAYLTTQGIDKSRLEAVVSFGESQPLIVTEGRERENRRTVTDVSGFVTGHPALLDGKYGIRIYGGYVGSLGSAEAGAGAGI